MDPAKQRLDTAKWLASVVNGWKLMGADDLGDSHDAHGTKTLPG